MPTNCLSFVDHFVESALKWLLPIFLKSVRQPFLPSESLNYFTALSLLIFHLFWVFSLFCIVFCCCCCFFGNCYTCVTVHAIHVVLHEKANYHMVTSNGWQSRSGISFKVVKACFKNFGVTFKGELHLKFRQSHRKTVVETSFYVEIAIGLPLHCLFNIGWSLLKDHVLNTNYY